MRNECVPRIARQKNDPGAAPFSRGDKILPAQFVPAIGLRPLLEAIVRINDPRNTRVAGLLGREGKGMIVAFAKVGAEKSADPGSSAFWNRNHDGIAAGKLARPAADVPADQSRHTERFTINPHLSSRACRGTSNFRERD